MIPIFRLGDAKIDVKKVKLKEKPLSEQEKKDKKLADIQSLSKIKSKEVTYSLASFDFASTHKPRKHLLLKPGKWSDNDVSIILFYFIFIHQQFNIITIYFENVHFFHSKLDLDICSILNPSTHP